MESNEDVISNFVKHIEKRYLKDSPITRRLSQEAAKMLSKLATHNNHD